MNREEVVPFKLASLEEFGTEDLWLKYLESNKPASRNAFVQFLFIILKPPIMPFCSIFVKASMTLIC